MFVFIFIFIWTMVCCGHGQKKNQQPKYIEFLTRLYGDTENKFGLLLVMALNEVNLNTWAKEFHKISRNFNVVLIKHTVV